MKKFVIISLTIIVAGAIFLVATINKKPLHIYLVPENFVGEVEVTFDQADSPPLAQKGNSYIYNIPDSGKLKTSSKLESGVVEVYYVDNQGQRKRLTHEQAHGVASTHGGDRNTTATFFIGTIEQYDNYVNQQ